MPAAEAVTLLLLLIPAPSCGGGTPGPAATIAAPEVRLSGDDISEHSTPLTLTIGTSSVASSTAPALVSLAWESWAALFQTYSGIDPLTDDRVVRIASHLAPGVLRVGGITADFIHYATNTGEADAAAPSPCPFGTCTRNLTAARFDQMLAFASRAGFELLFDVSVLNGRNCTQIKPACHIQPGHPPPAWCQGWCGRYPDWDTDNLRKFLEHIRARGHGPASIELGNELAGNHLPFDTVSRDVSRAAELLAEVWGSAESAPPLAAPATWTCEHTSFGLTMRGLLRNISSRAQALSFHSYPAAEVGPAALTNASWLRHGILTGGANASACLAAWRDAPAAMQGRVQLWVTEANSGAHGTAGEDSFANGFFTLAQYGHYASAAIPLVARFDFCCDPSVQSTLVAISRATTAERGRATTISVVPDYWIMLARKRLMGDATLSVTSTSGGESDSSTLVFASCTLVAGAGASTNLRDIVHPALGNNLSVLTRPFLSGTTANGSVTLSAVNVGDTTTVLALHNTQVLESKDGVALRTTPRLEWIFTAASSVSTAPFLNGDTEMLEIQLDGSLPSMPGHFVPVGGEPGITLPPRSQAFVVLLAAHAPACGGDRL